MTDVDESSIPQQNLDGLDLSGLPPIFVSNTHFEDKDIDDLHELEENLTLAKAQLTYDINEAELILSKVKSKVRIRLDLRGRGLFTEEAKAEEHIVSTSKLKPDRKSTAIDHDVIDLVDSSTESENESSSSNKRQKLAESVARGSQNADKTAQQSARIVRVVKIDWFTDSHNLGRLQPLDQYTTYTGRCVERTDALQTPPSGLPEFKGLTATPSSSKATKLAKPISVSGILERAQEDSPAPGSQNRFGKRKFGLKIPSATPSSWEANHGTSAKYAHLLQETTTEHDEGSSSDLPEMPEWVKKGVKYACQRLTPKQNPNDPFLDLLREIKLARVLTNDEIGVRAYSTSIAALAAYKYKISSTREILAIPGCDTKIANLWVEWKNTGKLKAVEDLETDRDLKILRTFYDIWGVGVTTARDFYYNKGWSELDDIIEQGWNIAPPVLSRVQKIGVKYYDEFQDRIPRAEVAQIGEIVRQHCVKVRDERIQTMIVGGYRRGKEASGDVDIVVSHPEEAATSKLVEDIVNSLEEAEWITHTLTISLNSTERGQQTLPFRAGGGGHGFDTLDKALVVWQNPEWPTKARDRAENPQAKNPNIHRRVDIIVSPWRTVGCAVVGWSGGTTFERDLRRYAKNVKSWKFDSSGCRDRRNGEVVDVEGYYSWGSKEGTAGRAGTMEEAERRVFESFGLTYRAPTERCTG